MTSIHWLLIIFKSWNLERKKNKYCCSLASLVLNFSLFLSRPEFCKEGLSSVLLILPQSPFYNWLVHLVPHSTLCYFWNDSVIITMFLGFGLSICFVVLFFVLFSYVHFLSVNFSTLRTPLFSHHQPLAAMHHNHAHPLPPLGSSPVPLTGLSSS